MKKIAAILIILAAVFLLSCAAVQQQEKLEQANLLYIEGTVLNAAGKEATVELNLPVTKPTPDSPIGEIARQVVQKSILLEGMKTEINGKQALLKEVRGNVVKAEFEGPVVYAPGTVLRLDIPKKTIAIVDFEVIKGKQKEVGRVTLEGLTTALIDSGQFTVVERSKLKTIMSELELSMSGMTKDTQDKTVGKLFFADLILTGTLAETQGEWDINLRILNTRTGQAVSAITMKTALFKPSEIRDSGPLNEDFEVFHVDSSWVMERFGKNAFYQNSLDRVAGAEGSKKAMRVDFKFIGGERPDIAQIENRRKRDLSLYDGIEFYAKASDNFHGYVSVITSQPDDLNKMDSWTGFFQFDKDWEKIRIPFNDLVVGRRWIKQGAAKFGAKPGDQVMRLNRVESFRIGIQQMMNGDVAGTFWIDRIGFYSDQ